MDRLQKEVDKVFTEVFSRTPLKQRLDDILSEAIELSRCVDIKKIKEELGDLLASSMMLANEANWSVEDLVHDTLKKVERRKEQYKTLGRKTEIALFGGAYNPISNGHIQVAQFVLNASKVIDEVWLMPCYGHMAGKHMVDAKHRLEMCRLAAKVDARIKVFDYEIKHKLQGETYQTVKLLLENEDYKDTHNFSWIIGQDNANTFDKWVNYENLEKLIRFIVVPRKGYSLNPKVDWYLKPPHIYLGAADNSIIEISSTHIRERIALGFDNEAAQFLHPDVSKYIHKLNLY